MSRRYPGVINMRLRGDTDEEIREISVILDRPVGAIARAIVDAAILQAPKEKDKLVAWFEHFRTVAEDSPMREGADGADDGAG